MRGEAWCVLLLLFTPTPAVAQDSALVAALEGNRQYVELDASGQLAGDGGESLLAAGRESRFFLIGEQHGIAEVPKLTMALFRALAPAGYRHLAIETGETVAAHLNRLTVGPDPRAAVAAFVEGHWPGVPFYNLAQEVDLLIAAVQAAGDGADVLWGLDYGVMADRYALRRLLELAPSPAARSRARAVIAVADSMFGAALETGNPGSVFMFAAPDTLISGLRVAYAAAPGSEADRVLSLLEETLRINGAYLDRRYHDSNLLRATHLKRQFWRRYRAASAAADEPPRVMLKFGANHVIRGRNFTHVFDLGTLAHELAEAEGGRAFGLMVMGGEGSMQARFDPRTFGYQPAPIEAGDWANILYGLSDPQRWTLFDLRPVRRQLLAGELGEVPTAAARVIEGFDAVLVLSGSGPADPLVER